MIVTPRRSVTRFFVPLIDVMVLLFCIFLLMPAADPGPEVDTGAAHPLPAESSTTASGPAEIARLARQLQVAKQELERLRQEQLRAVKRLQVVVLEIDPATGLLSEGQGADRSIIDSEARAAAMIDRHRRRAGDREVYFLFLYPRALSPWPTQGQIERYERWFADVPHGFDNPLSSRP